MSLQNLWFFLLLFFFPFFCSRSVLRSWSEGEDELAHFDPSLAYATTTLFKKKINKNSWKTKGNPTIAFSISPLALLWSHSISKLIFVDKHLGATLKVTHLFHLTSRHSAAEGFIRHVTRFSSRWKGSLQALEAVMASIQDGSSAFTWRGSCVFHRAGPDSATRPSRFLRIARRFYRTITE